MTSARPHIKPVIGWREWVSLPGLGISSIKAKIDTGARSSALHASEMEIFRRRGRDMVRFTVYPYQRNSRDRVVAEVELYDRRMVRSSSGDAHLRPVILTELMLMGERKSIELTLIDRSAMGFRMLLGREAIRGDYVVDPGRSYLGGKVSQRQNRPTGRRL
ncbi:MAG: ATP-dependent zinc protease [Deltaproteobacteria bacterium]|nr:ATP-dependent zinc protease [Deltaproteobacteria bacterium]